jgi:hypothetical protein
MATGKPLIPPRSSEAAAVDGSPPIRWRRQRLAALRLERERRRRFLHDQFPARRAREAQLAENLHHVIVILGSARGGTSAFKDTLSAHRSFVAMPGEHRPVFTLFGLNYPDHGGLDEGADQELAPDVASALLFEILAGCQTCETPEPTPEEVEHYAWEWTLRLPLQWPELEVDAAEIVRTVRATCTRHRLLIGRDPDRFRVALLRELCALDPTVDPWLYHLPAELVGDAFPDREPPRRPGSSLILEISPYLLPLPQKLGQPRAQQPRALLIKASSDCYRLPLIRQVFRSWNKIYIHLTRNPLAAMNGLLDGWKHPAYWQHVLSRADDSTPRGRRFWKFDLYENWRADRAAPLGAVCARQWVSSHARILSQLDRAEARHRFRFEDFQRDEESRKRLMDQVCAVLGLDPDVALSDRLRRPRVVNATRPPRPGRWKERGGELLALLDRDDVRATASSLGYNADEAADWL